ncbi:DNA cytosine methyltransferase [Streptomyces lydicus]
MGSSGDPLTSIEICAGAGGQALGLHDAGFRHLALLEIDKHACETLRANIEQHADWKLSFAKHPGWKTCEVIEDDLKAVDPSEHKQLKKFGLQEGDLDLLAGGVPCPPFSVAGKQLGEDDERDLFPRMIWLVGKLRPKAVMIENVRGILDAKFEEYRRRIVSEIAEFGYEFCGWEQLEARDYGVAQIRPRAILVMISKDVLGDAEFKWPDGVKKVVTVAEKLEGTMWERFEPFGARGKEAFENWLEKATKRGVEAPTLVGGSKKHGGADLGPSRAKAAWAALGVNALGVANDVENCDPERDLFREAGPMLTVEQAALIQGFPRHWKFKGGKTARYRQVGNAFPPPVAKAVGEAIKSILRPEQDPANAPDDALKNSSVEAEKGLLPAARTQSARNLDSSLADRSDDLQGTVV